MVDIGRAIRPLIRAGKRAFAVMFMKAEGRHRADFDLFGELFEARCDMLPVIQRGLKGRGDARRVGRACQVF